MGVAEILALITGASKLVNVGLDIVERMSREGRKTMTPAEIARLKAEQKFADDGWQAQLARLREGAE